MEIVKNWIFGHKNSGTCARKKRSEKKMIYLLLKFQETENWLYVACVSTTIHCWQLSIRLCASPPYTIFYDMLSLIHMHARTHAHTDIHMGSSYTRSFRHIFASIEWMCHFRHTKLNDYFVLYVSLSSPLTLPFPLPLCVSLSPYHFTFNQMEIISTSDRTNKKIVSN